jgi:hypothetical protein
MIRVAWFLAFFLLGCGTVDAIEIYGDGSPDVVVDSQVQTDVNPEVPKPTDGNVFQDLGGSVDARLSEPPPLSTCTWDPLPWTVMPCPDGVTAVCCYTRQDGSCDGRKDGCVEGGKECVLTCN